MRIAVCDDLPEALLEMKDLLACIPETEADYYTQISEFFEEIKDGVHYDAVLMDLDWKKEKTGIDFAEELLNQSPDTKIIYVTAYTLDYVEDIFLQTSNLSGFLMKPVKLEQLKRNLEKVQKQNQMTDGKLMIQYKGNTYIISNNDILYLESHLHKSQIVTSEHVYECTERLESLAERLSENFLMCHKSFVVNMDHVHEFGSKGILLDNGELIPVSKKRYHEAKERFFTYMAGTISG